MASSSTIIILKIKYLTILSCFFLLEHFEKIRNFRIVLQKNNIMAEIIPLSWQNLCKLCVRKILSRRTCTAQNVTEPDVSINKHFLDVLIV